MKTYKINRVFYSLGVIVLGLVLLIKPSASLTLVSQCIGVFLLAGGVLSAVTSLRNRTVFTGAFLMLAVILVVLGIWILSNPYRLASLAPTIIGVFVLLSGLLNVGEAVVVGRNQGRWGSSLILGLITIGLGLWLITRAFSIASILTRIGGAILIYDGLSDLLITWRLKPAVQATEPIDVESHEVYETPVPAPAAETTEIREEALLITEEKQDTAE